MNKKKLTLAEAMGLNRRKEDKTESEILDLLSDIAYNDLRGTRATAAIPIGVIPLDLLVDAIYQKYGLEITDNELDSFDRISDLIDWVNKNK